MSNNDETTVTVKKYKGDDVCAECGRYIRNVIEIDGVPYGIRCCEKHLPRTHKIVKGEIIEIVSKMDIARSMFADQMTFVRFCSQPTWQLVQFVESRPIDHPIAKGVRAIIEARRSQ